MATVREGMAAALERIVDGVVASPQGFEIHPDALRQARAALDRHRAEPEGRLYPERAIAPLRRAVQDHIDAYRKGGNLFAVAHWEAALKPLDEPEEPCTAACDNPTEAHCVDRCGCYEAGHQAGLEAQRERVGGGKA